MERTFAGFWVDGAVRKPDPKHYDVHGEVVSKRKSDGDLGVWRSWGPQLNIADFYWLDTTTPTELTPQQVFELMRVVYPEAVKIERADDTVHGWTMQTNIKSTKINWNGITEYPPRERWRVPTDADKGKPCRFKEKRREWKPVDSYEFNLGTFLCSHNDKFVVESRGVISLEQCCEVIE